MAQTVLWGTDASVASLSGSGCLFNAFSVSITQGIAEAAGFGDTWVRRHGTIKGATCQMSGFTTKGTTSDAPGIAAMTRTGSTITLTFFTACTLAFTGIQDGFGGNVIFTGNQTSSYSYASDGACTETWVTT